MKKISITVIALFITLCLSLAVFAAYVGDVNNDGKVTASDARIILRHSAKIELIADNMLSRADIDGNGKVNAADARISLRMGAKLEDLKEDHDHIYSSTEIQLQSCDKDGIIEYECTICGHKYQDVTKATGHSYKLVTSTEATCEKEGSSTQKCNKCGAEKTTLIEKTAHTMGAAIVTLEATCTSEGKSTSTCTVCGYAESQNIAKKAHSWLAATCTSAKKCSVCGETEGSTAAHQFGATVTEISASCAKEGRTSRTCIVCNYKETQTVAALHHEYAQLSVKSKPTCTSNGEIELKCANCGDKSSKATSAYGHKWSTGSCTTPQICAICNAKSDSTSPHKYSNGYCTVCGKSSFETKIYKGTGDSIITDISIPEGVFVATIKMDSTSSNSIKFHYNGTYNRLVLDHGKAYRGSCLLKDTSTKAVTDGIFEIETDGPWEIRIDKLSNKCTNNINGKGDTVTGFFSSPGKKQSVKITFDDTGSHSVRLFEIKSNRNSIPYDRLVLEHGSVYSGTVLGEFEKNTLYFFEVEGDGNWTISFGNDPVTTYVDGAISVKAQTTLPDIGHIEHSYTQKAIKRATSCAADGIAIMRCTVCGDEYDAIIPALEHTWKPATCSAPETCTVCGKTIGIALEHKWKDATCLNPSTCADCGLTKGSTSDHSWKDATCLDPKTCSVCGLTNGTTVDHSWRDATCQNPKTCTVCSLTEGSTIDHNIKAATCTTAEHCTMCNRTYSSALGHKYSGGRCTRCGQKDPSFDGVYLIGETWIVNGEWELTINSVTTHRLCNSYSNSREGYTNEQVITINYTYKNIGYYTGGQDLFFSIDNVYDERGQAAKSYACTHRDYHTTCIKGTSSTGDDVYVLKNNSDEITITFSKYTSNRVKETATFKVAVR